MPIDVTRQRISAASIVGQVVFASDVYTSAWQFQLLNAGSIHPSRDEMTRITRRRPTAHLLSPTAHGFIKNPRNSSRITKRKYREFNNEFHAVLATSNNHTNSANLRYAKLL